MNWKRIVGWSVLLMVLANVIGFASGLVMAYSEIDPATIVQTVKNSRTLMRVCIGVVAVLCYWCLGAGAPNHRAAHILTAFVLVQFMDMSLALLLGAQFSELIEPWGMLRSCLYALGGYVLARLSPNYSLKRTAAELSR